MALLLTETKRIFISFLIFGLLNNVLYVVLLTAAIDIVGSTPKAVVLLADIVPSLTIKLLAPFFIHLIPHNTRIWILVSLSVSGMLLVSLAHASARFLKVSGIMLASLSSGMGEVSFLQLTHYYDKTTSIGGFSVGTGGAGILGSFCFLLLTNILGVKSWFALLIFAIIPLGFPLVFLFLLPSSGSPFGYEYVREWNDSNSSHLVVQNEEDRFDSRLILPRSTSIITNLASHIRHTLSLMTPLFKPFMLPLCSVYIAEYTINQGVSPTLLFPLDGLPHWLFKSYRDIYVFYGFLYQLGVFISRSSVTFGLRFKKLYVLTFLQVLNLVVTIFQSLYDAPFPNIFFVSLLIFYEGLLGGLSYVNTFMSVSEQVPVEVREFSMACVSISDSFGVMVAGCINWWLEVKLCNKQVDRGRNWCRAGDSK